MGAGRVVFGAPPFDDPAGLSEAVEQVLIQAFVPEPAVEALDEGVLHRLSWRDVMPLDAGFVGPGEHGIRGEWCAPRLTGQAAAAVKH